jgi:cyclopropane-fatty-acyl-phospholipid synthase
LFTRPPRAKANQFRSFINHYIFPGGYLPSITQLLNHISTTSKGTLIVEKVENIGGHYAKTLRLWREAFLANFEEKIRPALEQENPGMSEEEAEVFRRKWEVRTNPHSVAPGKGAWSFQES